MTRLDGVSPIYLKHSVDIIKRIVRDTPKGFYFHSDICIKI